MYDLRESFAYTPEETATHLSSFFRTNARLNAERSEDNWAMGTESTISKIAATPSRLIVYERADSDIKRSEQPDDPRQECQPSRPGKDPEKRG